MCTSPREANHKRMLQNRRFQNIIAVTKVKQKLEKQNNSNKTLQLKKQWIMSPKVL
jgi:hypothetical protein